MSWLGVCVTPLAPCRFVVPMRKRPNCDFSFAGLKTSVRLAIESALPGSLEQQALQRQPFRPGDEAALAPEGAEPASSCSTQTESEAVRKVRSPSGP